MSESVSYFETTVYKKLKMRWTLEMNCPREHTVHSVYTEHNVHTVQFELLSYSGCEFVHKGEVSRFKFTNL